MRNMEHENQSIEVEFVGFEKLKRFFYLRSSLNYVELKY